MDGIFREYNANCVDCADRQTDWSLNCGSVVSLVDQYEIVLDNAFLHLPKVVDNQ